MGALLAFVIPTIILMLVRGSLKHIERGPYKQHEYKFCTSCYGRYSMEYEKCNTWGCDKPPLIVKLSDPAPPY